MRQETSPLVLESVGQDLLVTAFPYRRMGRNDLLIAGAFRIMIADDAAGLQVRIDRHRTHILEAALLEILTDPV